MKNLEKKNGYRYAGSASVTPLLIIDLSPCSIGCRRRRTHGLAGAGPRHAPVQASPTDRYTDTQTDD